MHGRLKIKTTAEKEAAEVKERTEKAHKFRAGLQLVLSQRSEKRNDEEVLAITSKLLTANPDVYTLWNYRREILTDKRREVLKQIDETRLNMADGNDFGTQIKLLENEFDVLGESELVLSEVCLIKNPKSYSAWFQRQFILNQMFNPNLKRELQLCNEALMKDDRNFHCWDHRTYVSKLLNIPIEEELSFTLDKINANFSNFSSWYYRSCLITDAIMNGAIKIDDIWDKEYDLVENAIFTDPSDQSAWFYHRWLTLTDFDKLKMKMKRNLHTVDVKSVIVDYCESLLIIELSRPVKHFPGNIILNYIMVDGNNTRIVMSGESNSLKSVWFKRLEAGPKNKIVVSIPGKEAIEVSFSENVTFRKSCDQETVQLNKKIYLSDEKKANLVELKAMEPRNKWVNLMATSCFESGDENQRERFKQLCEIDALRTNYYNDMVSKQTIAMNQGNWINTVHGKLADMKLTSLLSTSQSLHLHSIDVSKNQLSKLPSKLNDLVALKVLIADDNLIDTIDRGLKMLSIELLSLKRNRLKHWNQLSRVILHSTRLVKVYVLGNEMVQDQVDGEITKKLDWTDELIEFPRKEPKIVTL